MAFNSRIDTFVNVKIRFEGQTHRFKLPLRELAPSTLQDKLCQLLEIPSQSKAVFERFSDSSRTYVLLDPNNVSTYKQLHRAARAKLRLRLRASMIYNEKDEDFKQTSAKYDKNTVQAAFPPSAASIQTPITISTTSLSTIECPYKSNITNPINDIKQCLQKLHINDQVSSAAATVQTTAVLDERESNSTSINEPELALKTECSYKFDTKDDSHIASVPKKNIMDQRICEDFDIKKTSISSFSDLYALTVFCNSCSSSISGEHYHCSNCDGGDFDLCQKCVENGTLCYSEDHWLIKRFIKDGEPVNSITQTITSRSLFQSKQTKELNQNVENLVTTRTCNCCIVELTEEHFVTCTTCPDYDLCISCHVGLNHGHHPEHAFEPVIKDQRLDTIAKSLLAPGRNVEHDASCDGCDKVIFGIRHKCLDCPDWDYCSSCIPNAKNSHPRHRFVPIYEKFDRNLELNHLCPYKAVRHFGVFCDGPFCKNISSYITGDRYKCAICDDIDFCARCETSMENKHDPNHPLIKLKVPIRNVSVEAYDQGYCNKSVPNSGSKQLMRCPISIEASSATSSNAEIQVQTIFDLNPTEISKAKQEDKTDLTLCEIKEPSALSLESKPVLVAHFIRDTIADGTIMLPNLDFKQTWYLCNAGESSWPSGCYVKFVSGAKMFYDENECLDSNLDFKSMTRSSLCEADVAPGKTVGFTVSLKTPRSPGNYISFWRLATANGYLVGPKLWCEINVEEEVPATEKKLTEVISVEGSNMIFPKLEKETLFTIDDQEQTIHVPAEVEICEFSEGHLSDKDLLDFSETEDEYEFLDLTDVIDEECIMQLQ
ncbi:putative zz type zinc finger domain-containing protein [Erysiphe neolycopersici]|uniref:Putative zz type zinc finger domain-containing protein n=1 Tax=Erysiphe neolycopersici TaxID=212602 RepID=A0A420I3N9_9PEZI|nr:putative zz type zinc finger domain-containing protein [Erysiphe neolycopersici]